MKTFYYKMRFSPYGGKLKAKNKKDALEKVKNMFLEYDISKTLQYLN